MPTNTSPFYRRPANTLDTLDTRLDTNYMSAFRRSLLAAANEVKRGRDPLLVADISPTPQDLIDR